MAATSWTDRVDGDGVRGVAGYLRSAEAGRLACACSATRDALGEEGFWADKFECEFRRAGFVRSKRGASAKEDCAACHEVEGLAGRGESAAVTWRVVTTPQNESDEEEVLSPLDRQGSDMAVTSDGKLVFLYGGWTTNGIGNDCWLLNTETLVWSFVGAAVTRPTYGHRVSAVNTTQAGAYMFLASGGLTRGGYGGASNGAILFSISKETERVQLRCLRPTFDLGSPACGIRRAYHTAVEVFRDSSSPLVLLFGGFDEDGPLAALESFDVAANAFALQPQTESGSPPCPRFGHSCTLVRSDRDAATLLVAGGSTDANNMKYTSTNADLRDLHLLTVHRSSLGASTGEGDASDPPALVSTTWTTVDLGPSATLTTSALQRCHSATLVGSSTILFFGGGAPFRTTDRVTLLQLPAWPSGATSPADAAASLATHAQQRWRSFQVRTPGSRGPVARQNHSAVWVPNNRIIVFGGCLASTTLAQEELGDTWELLLSSHGAASS